MGLLYYFAKPDGDLFALNKINHYASGAAVADAFREPARLREVAPTRVAFVRQFIDTEDVRPGDPGDWPDRIAQRLFAWAGDAPIKLVWEGDPEVDEQDGRERITGSAHDSDYEDDGVTYKAGSAW